MRELAQLPKPAIANFIFPNLVASQILLK